MSPRQKARAPAVPAWEPVSYSMVEFSTRTGVVMVGDLGIGRLPGVAAIAGDRRITKDSHLSVLSSHAIFAPKDLLLFSDQLPVDSTVDARGASDDRGNARTCPPIAGCGIRCFESSLARWSQSQPGCVLF